MRTAVMLIAIAVAAPASAQSRVYGNADLGKPIAAETRLSPEDAVRVLRASHSIADLTDYRSPGPGPTIVVMGESTTPWDWPANAFAPTQPLGNDYYDLNNPYGGAGNLYGAVGYGYVPSAYPYYGSSHFGRHRRGNAVHPSVSARPGRGVAAQPPAATPRHVTMSSQSGGRRR
jgi:hypothetical protein